MSLDLADRIRLSQAGKIADSIEVKWNNKFRAYLNKLEHRVLESLMSGGKIPSDFDFNQIVVDHYFDSSLEGIRVASLDAKYGEPTRLAKKLPKKKFREVKDLFKQWEKWRTEGKIPAKQKKIADGIKRKYLEKLQEVWDQYGESFRSGKDFDTDKFKKAVKDATNVTESRAKTIIQTETTSGFNQARREIYDQSPDVTHYLFLAIRDAATTAWCSTRTGLVYKKGDPLTDKETPAIHWNCRSEMLPLSPLNPRHQKLIENDKLNRRNNTCEPLPKGWVKR